jgi:hypothetical protein
MSNTVPVPLDKVSNPQSVKIHLSEPGSAENALLIYTGFIEDLLLDNTQSAGGFTNTQALSLIPNSDRTVDLWRDITPPPEIAVVSGLTIYYNSDGPGASAQLNSATVDFRREALPGIEGAFNFLTLTVNLKGQHTQIWGVSYQVTVHHHFPGALKSAQVFQLNGSSTPDHIRT